ncbi:RWD-domain-containing protein [Annulohypoxylon maeteangense]|uniref:RWD-domain-containing protein n=1 Tax=Annulohypoxylon maeteangense TaxID=1927788 RepID=UPI0020072EE6|nr:RWD-domain-containing protein [Annulohypoxylon maeteangense]KAI0885125.1 RWD-domain-containing protein [Annulohypoxylon maeteangense]
MEVEDIRQEELSTVAAIYPELQVDENDPNTISLELLVSLVSPLTVLFPAATEVAPPVEQAQNQIPTVAALDSHDLSYLPSLQIRIELPDGYPQEKPPKANISTTPPWLSEKILSKLESDVSSLWEELGRDQVIFTYIDSLQQLTEDVFGLVDSKGRLEVAPEYKIAILDYDIKARRRAFEKETFDCGVCLEPKKGVVCHRLLECGHVFCVNCLQEFYNNAITEGDISSVQCLEPKCAKQREDSIKGSIKKKRAKTFISPSELLQIPLEHDVVMRYVMLRHKTELESDKNTVYCPRPWCQGAARSKKHKKPEGLEFVDSSDDEDDEDEVEENEADKVGKKFDRTRELLAICEDCDFAFCTRCEQTWHGEFKHCYTKDRQIEVTAEEKASLEYMKLHTSECPTCGAPCQKTHGCNHMQCFKCRSHFCYLCSSWLDPSNPYQHFNVQPSGKVNDCYLRLWELERGDGNDVGQAFEGDGGGHPEIPAAQPERLLVVLPRAAPERPANDLGDGPGEADVEEAPRQQPRPRPGQPQPPRDQPNGRVAVAREGPLVLRIEGDAPPVQAEVVRRPHPGIPNPREGNQGLNNNAGQRGGRGDRRGRVRQNNRNRPQGQNRQANDNGRDGQIRMGDGDVLRGDGQLDARQEAWVRQFVQLALNDQEDQIEDSDDE